MEDLKRAYEGLEDPEVAAHIEARIRSRQGQRHQRAYAEELPLHAVQLAGDDQRLGARQQGRQA